MPDNPLKKPRQKPMEEEQILTPKKPQQIKPKSDRVSHELPKPKKPRTSYGNTAPRTEYQKEKARQNLAKARAAQVGKPKTEAQKAAAKENFRKAQQESAKKPRTAKQIEAAKKNIAKANAKRKQERQVDIPDISLNIITEFEDWCGRFSQSMYNGRAYMEAHVQNTWNAAKLTQEEYAQLLELIQNNSSTGFSFELAFYEDLAVDVFSKSIVEFMVKMNEMTNEIPSIADLAEIFEQENNEAFWQNYLIEELKDKGVLKFREIGEDEDIF